MPWPNKAYALNGPIASARVRSLARISDHRALSASAWSEDPPRSAARCYSYARSFLSRARIRDRRHWEDAFCRRAKPSWLRLPDQRSRFRANVIQRGTRTSSRRPRRSRCSSRAAFAPQFPLFSGQFLCRANGEFSASAPGAAILPVFLLRHSPYTAGSTQGVFDLYRDTQLTLPVRTKHELEDGFPGNLIRSRERGWYAQTDAELEMSLKGYYATLAKWILMSDASTKRWSTASGPEHYRHLYQRPR